jgi:hypothetical protein
LLPNPVALGDLVWEGSSVDFPMEDAATSKTPGGGCLAALGGGASGCHVRDHP